MASSAKITLEAMLKMDNKQFKAGMRDSEGQAKKLQTNLAGVGRAIGAAFSVTAIASATRSIIRIGSEITDLAIQAGLTTDEFQALEHAAIKAGVAPDIFRTTMNKLSVVMGQAQAGMKTYIDLFARVGIEANELKNMSIQDVFTRIAKTMSESERGSVEFGAALELLGTRSGGKLIEVMERINQVGFKGLIDDVRNAGTLMENELLKRLDDLEDRLQVAKKRAAATGGALAGAWMDVWERAGIAFEDIRSKTPAENPWKTFATSPAAEFYGAFAGVGDRAELDQDAISRRKRKQREEEERRKWLPTAGPKQDAHVRAFEDHKRSVELARQIAKITERGDLKRGLLEEQIAELPFKIAGRGARVDEMARFGGFTGATSSGMQAADKRIQILSESARIQREISRNTAEIAREIAELRGAEVGD